MARQLAAKWLIKRSMTQTEHNGFAKMSANRRRAIACRFCTGSLKNRLAPLKQQTQKKTRSSSDNRVFVLRRARQTRQTVFQAA